MIYYLNYVNDQMTEIVVMSEYYYEHFKYNYYLKK